MDIMSQQPDDATRDDAQDTEAERVQRRAELLPEEESAGSDDPEAQAAEILRESDERTDDPSGTRAESTQTPGEDRA